MTVLADLSKEGRHINKAMSSRVRDQILQRQSCHELSSLCPDCDAADADEGNSNACTTTVCIPFLIAPATVLSTHIPALLCTRLYSKAAHRAVLLSCLYSCVVLLVLLSTVIQVLSSSAMQCGRVTVAVMMMVVVM